MEFGIVKVGQEQQTEFTMAVRRKALPKLLQLLRSRSQEERLELVLRTIAFGDFEIPDRRDRAAAVAIEEELADLLKDIMTRLVMDMMSEDKAAESEEKEALRGRALALGFIAAIHRLGVMKVRVGDASLSPRRRPPGLRTEDT